MIRDKAPVKKVEFSALFEVYSCFAEAYRSFMFATYIPTVYE